MPQLNLKGKKKSDLAVIAQVAGLLTATETRKMTKQELLDYLLRMEEKLVDSVVEDKPASAAEPTTAVAESEEKPAVKETETKVEADSKSTTAGKSKTKTTATDKSTTADKSTTTAKSSEVKRATPRKGRTTVKRTVRKTQTINQVADTDKSDKTDTKTQAISGSSKVRAKQEEASDLTMEDELSVVEPTETEESIVVNEAEEALPETAKSTLEVEEKPEELLGGVLEIMQDNYGFLRRENYLQSNNDIYVPPQFIRRFGLRTGDYVVGPCRHQRDNDRYQALYYVKEVNGLPPDKMLRRPNFDRLTPIYPNERFVLETGRQELSTRIIDLVAPIGKGQRGMIVSPPKAGKTILLQKIAKAISMNNPDAKLIVLLIDERPEEVTDMQRSIDGEVVYSTFDKTPENHVRVTELVLERAMRLVELKQDVVILLDSITRMGRAYNLTITPTGRTLSGGLDPGALYGPKRFFGAARNIENGGSLTIIATALIETGSRMDEVIFEEFKGTGNMEVLLDRKLSEKRIFPAIDITRSSTRREELLLDPKELDAVWGIRKAFGSLDTAAVTETIISLLLKTKDNDQFISSINISLNDKALYDAMRGNLKTNSNNGK
ncbi:MAG TPA: transcription termination factor Rho [Clostridiaceae bacterium]|nr:transcription termination factor Rho [Clostridiaceae bacterium]